MNIEPEQNVFEKFYEWLCPTVPFEFLKRQSPDSFAASISAEGDKKSGWGIGSYRGKINVELTPDMDNGYRFSVRRSVMTYFVTKATGTITPVNRELVQIQGTAITHPRAMMFIFFLPVLIILASWGILMVGSVPDLGVLVLVAALSVASMAFWVRTWKAMMTLYTDMLVGTLARLS